MPAFKRPDLVEQGLQAIKDQMINVDYQVIVVNDGIEDYTEMVCNRFKKIMDIRYIFSGQRNHKELIYRCPSFAINVGVKNCTGDIILLTSPEIYYLTTTCLNNMIALKRKKENQRSLIIPELGYDDQKGLVTKKIMAGEKINPELEPLTELNIEFPFCLMMNKWEFTSIGDYDEDFTGYCYDDADFIDRLTTAGCGSYIYAEGHKILHLFHGIRSRRDGLKDRTKAYKYNQKLYNDRKGTPQRNIGKEWGVVNMEERKEEFTETYEQNKFKGKVSKSGTGSDLENVQILIPKLANFINENNIQSMVDAPCGDFNWMPFVLKQSAIKEYRGYDIVDKMIKDNKKKAPGVIFEQKDIVIDGRFGKADLLFCRDCLVHLSFESVKKVIKNFFYSDIKYFMATTFTDPKRINVDYSDGTNWVPMNLMASPFNLPAPRFIINEGYTGNNGEYSDKSLAVWEKIDFINHIEFN